MASEEMQVASATAADVAANMEHHRETYLRFLGLLKYTMVGTTIILIILFLIFI